MKRYKLLALLLSLVLHAIAVGILCLLKVTNTERHSTEKSITLIPIGVYGYEPASGGNSEPKKSENLEPAQPTQQTTPKSSAHKSQQEDLLTSKESNAPTAEQVKKKKEQKEDAQKRAKDEQKKREQQEKAINSKIAGAFGKKGQQNGKSGSGEGKGANNSIGAGYSLSGRNIVGSGGYPVRPEGFVPVRGTVIVRILVNAQGSVTEASVRLKGTDITNSQTINAAIRAAKQTRFNASPGAPLQEGTITYHFDIQ